MYGKIEGSEWGKQSDVVQSDKFRDGTFEDLKRIAYVNHPILDTIQIREWDVEHLLANEHPARTEDVPEDRRPITVTLAGWLEEECEENGADSEWAQKLRASMNWKENSDKIEKLRDEIKTLRQELRAAKESLVGVGTPETDKEKELYSVNRAEVFKAEEALKSTIEWTVTKDECGFDWHDDYRFRDNFEAFLSDISDARQRFRKTFDHKSFIYEGIPELVQKYLENPSWHLPQITNFLLVDLIDSDLIMIEKDYYIGLFAQRISNEIDIWLSECKQQSFEMSITPCLPPKAKKRRRNRHLKEFCIGVGLTYILSIGSWKGEKITDLLINQGIPFWIFPAIWIIAGGLILLPIMTIVLEYINKRRIKYKNIFKQAYKLLKIRWDIYSETYDAKTCIERLKKLDNQDLHISSLIYPLLELQLKFREE